MPPVFDWWFLTAIDFVLAKEEYTIVQLARREERSIVDLISNSARRVNYEKQGTYGDDVRV